MKDSRVQNFLHWIQHYNIGIFFNLHKLQNIDKLMRRLNKKIFVSTILYDKYEVIITQYWICT